MLMYDVLFSEVPKKIALHTFEEAMKRQQQCSVSYHHTCRTVLGQAGCCSPANAFFPQVNPQSKDNLV